LYGPTPNAAKCNPIEIHPSLIPDAQANGPRVRLFPTDWGWGEEWPKLHPLSKGWVLSVRRKANKRQCPCGKVLYRGVVAILVCQLDYLWD